MGAHVFDLFKAFDQIESSHKYDFFSQSLLFDVLKAFDKIGISHNSDFSP